MKYQVLFSLKNNEEMFMSVVCCSCDWRLKGQFSKLNYIFKIICIKVLYHFCLFAADKKSWVRGLRNTESSVSGNMFCFHRVG